MIMESQLTFSDLYSQYVLSQILKLHFIRSSGKLRTIETGLEQVNLAPLKKSSMNQGYFDVFKESFFFSSKTKTTTAVSLFWPNKIVLKLVHRY